MYKIRDTTKNILSKLNLGFPHIAHFNVMLELWLVLFAIFCLTYGSFLYIGATNPNSLKVVKNVQAAFNEGSNGITSVLSLVMSPSSSGTSPESRITPTLIPEQEESPSESVPSYTGSVINQYLTSIDKQKVKDIINAYLKSGTNLSFTDTDGFLYLNSSASTGTTNNYTTNNTYVTNADGSIFTFPMSIANGGTGGTTVATAVSNLGLASGGTNDIWLHKTGGTLTGAITLDTTDSGNIFKITPRGNTGFLNGSGGALFLDNSNNPGSGIGIYSTAGAEAQGNMINVTTTNSNFSQAAFFMSYHGNSNAVEIQNFNNDNSANALAVTGNNAFDSTLGIIGHENGKGTIKISHYKNDGVSDANASGLSIDLRNSDAGETTAAQGIYVDSTEVSGTTGNLLRLRNKTIDRFVVNSLGSLQIGSTGTDTTITKLGNNSGDQFFVGTNGAFRVQRSAGNSEAFRVQVNGDSQGRWLGTSDGQLKWGSGNLTQDTVISRTGVGLLALQGAIVLNNTNGDFDNVIKGQTDSNLLYADASADKIGIGIAAPTAKLHVVGDLRVTGGIYDSSNSLGSNTYILTSTSTGTSWVSPSSVLGGAFVQNGNAFTANAVLGTTDTFPLILKTNNTEALRIDTSQNVGIGITTPTTRFHLVGAALDGTQADQAVGIANISNSLTKNDGNTRTYFGVQIKPTINAGASNAGTTYNILSVDTVNSSVTGVSRNLLRLGDGGTTRFLVQSAGNVVATATTTSGIAYQYNFDSITSGTGISLSVNALLGGNGLNVASSATGNNMVGNLANISFTGNHATNTGTILRAASTGALNTGTVAMFSNAGAGLGLRVNDDGTDSDATAFVVDSGGSVGIGSTAPSQPLDVEGLIQTDLGTSQSSVALCHSGVAASGTNNDVNIVDCTGTITADYMEMYPVESGIAMGDIVMAGSTYVTTTNGHRTVKLTKSNSSYQQGIIGIVSNKDDAGDFNSIGYNIKPEDNPAPIALNGRVKVKISQSSTAIEPGDYITSSNETGKGIKASHAGYMVGKALESWSPNTGQNYVMVFVSNTYADPNELLAKLSIDPDGFLSSPKIKAEQINFGQQQLDLNTVITNQSTSISNIKTSTDARLAKIEQNMATMSAALAQINTVDITNVSSIKTNIANLDQRTSTLEQQVASLSAKLTDTVLGASTASGSALFASNSATLDNLIVTGKTTINDLGITGNVSAGVLTIEGLDPSGSASINTLSGNLKLQANALGGIDILNGKIVIDKEGSIKGNDNIRGINVSVKENDSSVTIKFGKTKSSTDYAVVVTPSWLTQTAVENKTPEGFTIKFSSAPPAGAKVDWVVIE